MFQYSKSTKTLQTESSTQKKKNEKKTHKYFTFVLQCSTWWNKLYLNNRQLPQLPVDSGSWKEAVSPVHVWVAAFPLALPPSHLVSNHPTPDCHLETGLKDGAHLTSGDVCFDEKHFSLLTANTHTVYNLYFQGHLLAISIFVVTSQGHRSN